MAIRFDDYDDEVGEKLKQEVSQILVGDIVNEQPEQVIEPE
jgi:hypothetical protein